MYYNLDVIISVGYRVKSKRGIAFRKWANDVLKKYIIKGYAVNDNRIAQLNEVIRVMKRAEHSLDAKQILSVIEKFSTALDMLDNYDHQTLTRPEGNKSIYVITYEECRNIIDEMKYGNKSDVLGMRKMIHLKEVSVQYIKVLQKKMSTHPLKKKLQTSYIS